MLPLSLITFHSGLPIRKRGDIFGNVPAIEHILGIVVFSMIRPLPVYILLFSKDDTQDTR